VPESAGLGHGVDTDLIAATTIATSTIATTAL
jgi:hypothetical protein